MDATFLVIGLMLVFTGAVFFGYPVGLMIGRNGWGEPLEGLTKEKKED